jgi:ribosome biogenesis GTPase
MMSLSIDCSSLVAWGWTPYFHQQWFAAADENPKLADSEPGRVASVRRGDCLIVSCATEPRRAVLAGRFAQEPDATHVCVGDFVLVDWKSGAGLGRIEQVLLRTSLFQRKSAGPQSRPQPIAANIDLAIVVCALAPDGADARLSQRGVNVRRIERYLAGIAQAGVRPLVAVNKADLRTDASEFADALRAELGGAEIVLVSAHSGAGLEAIEQRLSPGSTAILVGASGVGKSSLTNRLLGRTVQRADSIREDDARGRHTTTQRELFALPGGALLVDTPGMREFGLAADPGEDPGVGRPSTGFADIDGFAAACHFRDCRHQREPGCAVLAALAEGELPAARLEHAQKLERELRWLRERGDAALRSKQRRERRNFSRKVRAVQQKKGNDHE